MLPKWHVLFGFIVSYILIYFFNFSPVVGITIFLASILIDLDHYFYYIYKKGKFNFINFYNESLESTRKFRLLPLEQRKKSRFKIFIFHGIEFWIILAALSFINKFFLLILIGIAVHMIADYAEIIHEKEPLYQKISQIYVYITNKNKNNIS